jgi:hypothetical protein
MIADEFKPLNGFNLPALLNAIAKRYGFSKFPTLEQARAGGTGAQFENGSITNGNKEIAISSLTLYNDGYSAVTSNTDDSDTVANDFFEWLKKEFLFRDPINEPLQIYQSDVVFNLENNPNDAFGRLNDFLKFVQIEMTPPNARTKKPVQFSALVFGADPTSNGPSPDFTLARRVGAPWHLGLYFSKANMKTTAHVKALEMLDAAILR